MTREEMRQIKEKRQSIELLIKSDSKLFGFKSIQGIVYKIINNFVFDASIMTDKNISVRIGCKPIILDEIFWEVFYCVKDDVKNKPVSFHVNGAFVARPIEIDGFVIYFDKVENANELFIQIMNRINNTIEEYSNKINDLNTFQEKIKDKPEEYLNNILIDIAKKEYGKALGKINECIKNKQDGRFSDFGSQKNIIDYAKEYCERNIK
jgi:hypothetical protein